MASIHVSRKELLARRRAAAMHYAFPDREICAFAPTRRSDFRLDSTRSPAMVEHGGAVEQATGR
jgi:hypothetical protein